MEQVFLGEYIRRQREDLGLTQAQLCEGICEPMTLSRLENGRQTPSYNRIKALLERLGLPGNRYFALLSKKEEEIEVLQKGIRGDVVLFGRAAAENRPEIREQAMAKLAKLEELAGEDNQIVQQYILSTRAALGKPEGPYSFEERLGMLMTAIRLTVPQFDQDEINLGWYSMEETTIISQIAKTYAENRQKRKAIDIYRQLLRYIEKNDRKLFGFAGLFCLVAHNCAIELALEKRYEESVEIAEQGWRVCIKHGNYQLLPGFLAILAECFYFTEKLEESKKLYLQAYCIYDSVGDKRNQEIIQQEMQERLHITPPY